MKQKFLANLLFLLLVNVLIKPFYIFGIDRTVQLTVGTAAYGLYFALYNFSILFYILLDLGLTSYNNRTIAQNPALLKTYLPNFLITKLCLSLIYLVLLFVLAALWGDATWDWNLLLPLGVNQILIAFILYFRSNITALQYFKLDAVISVLDKLLMIGICGLLLWGGVVKIFKIEYFIYAQTMAYGLTALISFGAIGRFITIDKWNFQTQQILTILKEGMPYALLILLMTIYTRIDSIMLERLLPNGKEQAGIYAAAYRLLDAVNMFGVLFATLLLPMFAKMLKDKKPIEPLVLMGFKLILTLACTVFMISYFFDEVLMSFLYGSVATPYWATVFRWLMGSFIPIGTMYIFSTLMTANGNLIILNGIALTSVVLNIGLNYSLIPTYAALGATIATLLTQSLVAMSQVIFSIFLLNIRFKYAYVFSILGFVLGLFLVNWVLFQILENWWIRLGCVGIGSLILAFLTRMIDLRINFWM